MGKEKKYVRIILERQRITKDREGEVGEVGLETETGVSYGERSEREREREREAERHKDTKIGRHTDTQTDKERVKAFSF